MCRYGDQTPISMQEKLFATIMMMVGFILMEGIVIGGWESILTNDYTPVATFTHRVKTVSACLVSTRMSPRFNCVYTLLQRCVILSPSLTVCRATSLIGDFVLLLKQVVCPSVTSRYRGHID